MRYGYRHTAGVIIIILLFVLGCITAAYGQVVTGSPNTPSGYSIDSTTGNLIQNSTLTSGTGWNSTGMMGSYTPDGYIFGYVSGTIDQTVNFNSVNFGYQNTSAVFATGIAYGFKYRFQCAQSVGTSCETGTSQDTLNATFTYTLPNGTIETSSSYGLGLKNINDGNPAYNPVWQQLAETYTFTGAKPLNQVGSAKLSITGMDAGFWACNPDCYGPQVKDAYIRLNYSVDPCILNPAFNPSCSGFQNIVQGSKSPTFYYSYNIAQSLPHIGGGVVLHGYDYGFNWYNYGSCYNTFLFWCTDWRTDGGGNINFRISDKNNSTMLQQQWYVGGNNSGGSFSDRYLFTESKNSLDMGSVQWWTSNVWNHFGWVGWTKPIWTPDPCYTNGLYSPNCSNFQDAVNKVLADIKAQQERLAANTPTTSSTSPAPGGSITVEVTASATNPSVSVTTSSVQTGSESKEEKTSSATSLALSLIRSNERRERDTAMQASSQAISQAATTAQQSQREAESVASAMQEQGAAASQAAADAAQQASRDSVTSQARTSGSNSNLVMSSPVRETMPILPNPQQASIQPTQTQVAAEPAAQLVTNQPVEQVQLPQTQLAIFTPMPQTTSISNFTTVQVETFSQPNQPAVNTSISAQAITLDIPQPPPSVFVQNQMQPQAPQLPQHAPVEITNQPIQVASIQTNIEQRGLEQESTTSPTNFTTNRTNPITEIVEGRPRLDTGSRQDARADTVNKSAQNNELAGGVDIASIAVAPQGFNVYASLVLRDAAFYAPKEIYRGQQNVDNARALRSLASDKLHQEMIDQQYRR